MSLGKLRTTALWIVATALMLSGVIFSRDELREAGLLVGMLALLSRIETLTHDSTLLVAHVIALFGGDLPIDSKQGRRAQRFVDDIEHVTIRHDGPIDPA